MVANTRALGRVGVAWRVVALRPPHVLRRCARCDTERSFVCSESFRINANKRILDVWLVYRCAHCEQTWNCAIYERVGVSAIAPKLYRGFLANDRGLAWRYAFEPERIRRAGARVEESVPYRVEGPSLGAGVPLEVRIALAHPVRVRLDRLLATELSISRAELRRWAASGRLALPDAAGDPGRPLRRGIRDGETVLIG